METTLVPQRWGKLTVPFFRRSIDRWFDNWLDDVDLDPLRGLAIPGFLPRIDVTETDKEVRVAAELPGMDEKDIDLKLTKDTLILKGEKKEEKEEKGKQYYRKERRYGSFYQEILLPEEVAQDKINAAFKGGVLTVTLPKTAETQREAKKIDIKTTV